MDTCFSCNHEKIKEKLLNSDSFSKKVVNASEIFALLGDVTRMRIMLSLMEGELCVYHICEVAGGKQSAISQHLRKLKDANLVKFRKLGNQVLYSIADEHVVKIIMQAIEHLDCK